MCPAEMSTTSSAEGTSEPAKSEGHYPSGSFLCFLWGHPQALSTDRPPDGPGILIHPNGPDSTEWPGIQLSASQRLCDPGEVP